MSKGSWQRCALALLLGSLCCLLACGPRDASWERVQRAGVLRVGLDPTYPPFEQLSGATVVGIDVDLAQALGAALGVRVEFTHYGYDGLYDALLVGQVDVLISALVVDIQRTRDFAYSQSYFNAGQVVLVRDSAESPLDLPADLDGRRLAVELGAEGHVLATAWQRQLPDLTGHTYGAPAEAIQAVLDGTDDAAVVDAISARLSLSQQPGLALAGPPVTSEPLAVVTRRDDAALLAQLDDALSDLQTSGGLTRLMQRWLWFADGG